MAINPPSDLVLGAVLAADPAKYRAAAERLQRAAAGGWTSAASLAPQSAAEPPTADAPRLLYTSTPARGAVQSAPAGTARAATRSPDAFTQLEAFVLQSFIQTMLPAGGSSQAFFGKGTAGEVWKSMLADKLGAELARSGQVGLARRLAAGRDGAAAAMNALSAAAIGGGLRASPSLLDALPYLQGSLPREARERS